MRLSASTVTAICFLLDLADPLSSLDQELETVFKERSDADWENVWHHERHARCRATLLRHLYWACEKDIYKMTRRTDEEHNLEERSAFPFLSVVEAKVFLRTRRNRYKRFVAPSITEECCHTTDGCTWEEYAEYCPANKRLRKQA